MTATLKDAILGVVHVYTVSLDEAMIPSDPFQARMELVRARNLGRGYLRDVLMVSDYPEAICEAFADDLTKSFSQEAIFRNTEDTVAGSRDRLRAAMAALEELFVERITAFFDMPRDYVLAMCDTGRVAV